MLVFVSLILREIKELRVSYPASNPSSFLWQLALQLFHWEAWVKMWARQNTLEALGLTQSGFFPSYFTLGAPQDASKVGVVAVLPVSTRSAQKKGVQPSPYHSICSEQHTEPSLPQSSSLQTLFSDFSSIWWSLQNGIKHFRDINLKMLPPWCFSSWL